MSDLRTELEALQAEAWEIEKNSTLHVTRNRMFLDRVAALVAKAEEEIRRREFKVYTEKEVAAMFQIGETTFRGLRQAGYFDHLQINSLTRYTEDHIPRIAAVLEKRARKGKLAKVS